ncbi:MAG: hypothetical protein LWY06_12990 [Firmicutes bacterium]|nr:hypothetical protein [Bacillota bacterium]
MNTVTNAAGPGRNADGAGSVESRGVLNSTDKVNLTGSGTTESGNADEKLSKMALDMLMNKSDGSNKSGIPGWHIYKRDLISDQFNTYIRDAGYVEGARFNLAPDGTLFALVQERPDMSGADVTPDNAGMDRDQTRNIYAVKDSTLQWNYQSEDVIYTVPCVGPDNSIYFVDAGGKINAVDKNGKKMWDKVITEEQDRKDLLRFECRVDAAKDGTVYLSRLKYNRDENKSELSVTALKNGEILRKNTSPEKFPYGIKISDFDVKTGDNGSIFVKTRNQDESGKTTYRIDDLTGGKQNTIAKFDVNVHLSDVEADNTLSFIDDNFVCHSVKNGVDTTGKSALQGKDISLNGMERLIIRDNTVYSYDFDRSKLTVSKGDKVLWTALKSDDRGEFEGLPVVSDKGNVFAIETERQAPFNRHIVKFENGKRTLDCFIGVEPRKISGTAERLKADGNEIIHYTDWEGIHHSVDMSAPEAQIKEEKYQEMKNNESQTQPEAGVVVEQEFVIIGGVKIPKRKQGD